MIEPDSLPRKSPRRATVCLDEHAAWVVSNAGVLLEQQKGRRSGGLWKLPALPVSLEKEVLFQTIYPFTHHKITLRVHPAPAPEFPTENQRWFALGSVLDEAAMPAGHRRALVALIASETGTDASNGASSARQKVRAGEEF